jgi:hypothetical protein
VTRLSAATIWLWKLVDIENGQVPNLGHNDGAYILPFTVCPYQDYRPVIYAAARTFLALRLIPKGPWDEMAGWLCQPQDQDTTEAELNIWHTVSRKKTDDTQPPDILCNPSHDSWAYLRVAKFNSRPAHADQLHLDLWWRGINLAQDSGTYLYNAPPPWDNALTNTIVHNTVMIDGQESMQRAGRFLYLDWAQARVLAYEFAPDESWESITAEHNGYRKIGVTHWRKVTTFADGHWEIIDRLDGPPDHTHTARLHWLLPDWQYELRGPFPEYDQPKSEIRIRSPFGWVTLTTQILSQDEEPLSTARTNLQLVRAGELLVGRGTVSPIIGWTSPLYGDKIPALAFIFEVSQNMPIVLKSEWILPDESR